MATSVKARRTEISLWYNSTPISEEVGPDVESITYTDCASDTCDSVDIRINARDGKWLNSWFPKKGATLHPKVNGLDWNVQNDRFTMDCGLFVLDDVQYGDAPGTMTLGGVSKPSDTDFSERDRTDVWKSTSIQQIGATIAERARKAGVEECYFDRGGFLFHGKIKALAEAAREGGLKF